MRRLHLRAQEALARGRTLRALDIAEIGALPVTVCSIHLGHCNAFFCVAESGRGFWSKDIIDETGARFR